MHVVLRNHWRSIALRGVGALVFAALAFLAPSRTLVTIVLLVGSYSLFDGAITLRVGIRSRHRPGGWGILIQGAFKILLGASAFLLTELTMALLVYAFAVWGIVMGVIELVLAYRIRRLTFAAPYWAMAGVASLACGVLFLFSPEPLLMLLVVALGLYGVIYGCSMLLLAWKLRRVEASLPLSTDREPIAH